MPVRVLLAALAAALLGASASPAFASDARIVSEQRIGPRVIER